MIRFTFFILLFFSVNSAFNQVINHVETDFKEQGLKLSIDREKPGELQHLKIINTNNNRLLKSFNLDNHIDLFGICTSYFGDRKFAVIAGRFKFYIINLSTDSLIGPLLPKYRDIRYDGQSGVLHNFKIFNNGQYLIFGAIDNGVYCYNMTNINKPFEVETFNPESKSFKSEFFFLDKTKESIYNGIVSSLKRNKQERWEIASRFLFQEYRMKENSENKIIKKQIENRYLLLYRMIDKDSTENIIVDYDSGKLLNNNEDKELIKRLTLDKK